jgi:hypothetical protein
MDMSILKGVLSLGWRLNLKIRSCRGMSPLVFGVSRLMGRLMKKAEGDSCTTGKSTIGDEKTWNVFMRLDTPEAK